jgi:hypothetical protein
MSEVKYKYDLHEFVRLEPGEECCLKKHFRRGPMKEVVGHYEAADRKYKDPERFYFHHVDTIVSKSKKRKKREEAYKKRALEYALEQAVEMWILSSEVARTRRGVKHTGRILTPHDALCKRVGNKCYFVGHGEGTPPPGMVWAYKKERKGIAFFLMEDDEDLTEKVRNLGEGSAERSAEPSAEFSAERMPGKVRNLSPQVIHTSRDAALTGEKRICLAVKSKSVTGITVKTVTVERRTSGTEVKAETEEQTPAPNPGADPLTSVASFGDLTDLTEPVTTIGEHFKGKYLQETESFITRLSDAVFDFEMWKSYPNWKELVGCCREEIEAVKQKPLHDRKDLAMLMGKAMTRLRKNYGKDTPAGWLPAKKTLMHGGAVEKMVKKVAVIRGSRLESWNKFCEGEGQKYETIAERGAAFDKLWSTVES